MKLIIVDDHPLMRTGIRSVLLNSNLKAEISGEAESAEELLKLLSKESADIVLLDIELSGRSGLDILGDIKKMYPQLPVLILSAYPEKRFALRTLKAGAAGYLNKMALQTELVKAIRTIVEQKKRYINETVAELMARQLTGETGDSSYQQLSNREFEVLSLIANGKKICEIADILSLSVQTIHTYHRRVKHKMNMNSDAQLIRYAVEHELVA